jgi:hypothetical protein
MNGKYVSLTDSVPIFREYCMLELTGHSTSQTSSSSVGLVAGSKVRKSTEYMSAKMATTKVHSGPGRRAPHLGGNARMTAVSEMDIRTMHCEMQ